MRKGSSTVHKVYTVLETLAELVIAHHSLDCSSLEKWPLSTERSLRSQAACLVEGSAEKLDNGVT